MIDWKPLSLGFPSPGATCLPCQGLESEHVSCGYAHANFTSTQVLVETFGPCDCKIWYPRLAVTPRGRECASIPTGSCSMFPEGNQLGMINQKQLQTLIPVQHARTQGVLVPSKNLWASWRRFGGSQTIRPIHVYCPNVPRRPA